MNATQALEVEIGRLRNRLDKAIVFEVGTDISIGMSCEDDLWRIRRDMDDGSCAFLNKSGIWENPPTEENVLFAERTGYDMIDEAFDAFDNYALNYNYDDLILNIVGNPNALKN